MWYEIFFQHTREIMFIINHSGRIIEANRTAVYAYGYAYDELTFMSFNDLATSETESLFVTRMAEAGLNGDKPFETVHRRKDGSIFPVEVIISRMEIGEETVYISVIHDITKRRQAEAALIDSEERYRMVFNYMLSGFIISEIICDFSGRPVDLQILNVNPSFEQIVGIPAKDMVGKKISEIWLEMEPNWILFFGQVALENNHLCLEQYAAYFGKYFKVESFSLGGGYFAAVFEDVTFRRQAQAALQRSHQELSASNQQLVALNEELVATNEQLMATEEELRQNYLEVKKHREALRESEARFRRLAENARDIIYRINLHPAMHFDYLNPAVKAITGESPETFYQNPKRALQCIHPADRTAFKGIFAGELAVAEQFLRWRCPDGRLIWLESRAVPVRDDIGRLVAVEGIARDVTERKQMEDRLRYLGMHDALTEVYNRAYFEQEMHRLESGRENPVGLIISDMDGLKLVNDTLGHAMGDKLLVLAARVLKSSFRDSDVVARIGGDEFAVLLARSDKSVVENACQRIREGILLNNKFNKECPLSLSLGYSVRTDQSQPMSDLFKEADNHMYREKLHRSRSARNSIVQTLMKALGARDFITEGHGERMQNLVAAVGEAIELPQSTIFELRLLAQFHDIGKVGIPDRILFKSSALNPDERLEMQRHCEIGYRIAKTSPELMPIADWIVRHHEWWNGQGYPLGLKDQQIPLECRILAIVDAYDAMTNDRPYRKALSHQEAIMELIRCAGKQFDPNLVPVVVKVLEGYLYRH